MTNMLLRILLWNSVTINKWITPLMRKCKDIFMKMKSIKILLWTHQTARNNQKSTLTPTRKGQNEWNIDLTWPNNKLEPTSAILETDSKKSIFAKPWQTRALTSSQNYNLRNYNSRLLRLKVIVKIIYENLHAISSSTLINIWSYYYESYLHIWNYCCVVLRLTFLCGKNVPDIWLFDAV